MTTKNLRNTSLCCLTLLTTVSGVARAEETCSDLLIQFIEPSAVIRDDLPEQQTRSLTALIPCDGRKDAGAGDVPTVLHFFEHAGNQLCVTQRTCGNIYGWQGSFGLLAGWSELTTLGHFRHIRNSLRYDHDWNGLRIVASFALGYGQIERDCSVLSRPTCVAVNK